MFRKIIGVLLLALILTAFGCGTAPQEDGEAGTARSGDEAAEETVDGTTTRTEQDREATTGVLPEDETTAGQAGSDEEEQYAGGQTADEAPAAAGGPDFTAAVQMRGGSSTEANGILAVRFGSHEGFERAVIDLGSGNSPAGRVPEWTISSPEGEGYVRVSLPSVNSTLVSDGLFPGDVLRDFYVVRSPDGGMFVDLIARQGFLYRVIELSDPARLVVDFKPSGIPLAVPLPVREGNTVLVSPASGARVSSPLTVSGYSRNFEATNVVILRDAGGEVIAEKTVQGNDWSATWGYFDTTLDFPPFRGEGTLQVGALSARDGSFEGVSIPISSGR
ncbi:hypothetical protein E0L93_14635 [Rubrobacter taiwanensis]|uniref:Bacterial spore germination immunoglobulin-like domain-containing protein n=1 Tax=Rubrobacter taiwanensis TaxID=185139 RepID=A0A4R1B9P9_9ACTN|nr:Gmad2 immunoglobulin-like domain-containing protein [Rubrobacter taiwanensis]TCJ13651.1 hypothetical protein E0L93_14635 [Rubrobacter taiwanensis]